MTDSTQAAPVVAEIDELRAYLDLNEVPTVVDGLALSLRGRASWLHMAAEKPVQAAPVVQTMQRVFFPDGRASVSALQRTSRLSWNSARDFLQALNDAGWLAGLEISPHIEQAAPVPAAPADKGSIGGDAEFLQILQSFFLDARQGGNAADQGHKLIAYIDARSPVAAAPDVDQRREDHYQRAAAEAGVFCTPQQAVAFGNKCMEWERVRVEHYRTLWETMRDLYEGDKTTTATLKTAAPESATTKATNCHDALVALLGSAALNEDFLESSDSVLIANARAAIALETMKIAEPSDPQIRTLAILAGGWQDNVTADWELTDRCMLKFARRVLATSSAKGETK